MQFGANIKSVGLPNTADEVMIVQGSMADGRFVALYGREGRTVGAVAVNQAQWLPFYERDVVVGRRLSAGLSRRRPAGRRATDSRRDSRTSDGRRAPRPP